MKCKKIFKEDNKVYMIDSNQTTLELTDITKVNRYENKNNVDIKDILNQFFKSENKQGYVVLEDLDQLVNKYRIDSCSYAETGCYDPDKSMLVYIIKNRNSLLDCQLKVFYSENEQLEFIVEFSKGASGDIPGISLFKYFRENRYMFIKPLIEKYFMLKDSCIGEIELIKNLYSDIEYDINRYYN
ncbi:MAG: hypothetical protein E7C47_09590 [Veillonella sp.]|uniref:hypothetical protein n=1 Tax=Veillonella sp. TaxID=1926307 RepID=UPI002901D316|nr:hypothetical protein [Veillonella sp.]MDU2702379.1 hypothetical protein [Veillonella sp.]